MPHRFKIPTDIYYGENCFDKLPKRLGAAGRAVAIVVSRSVYENYEEVCSLVDFCDITAKRHVLHVYEGGEPTLSSVETVREGISDADVCVAIGGGSVLDAAKAACAVAHSPHMLEEHFRDGVALPDEHTEFIAVPTTSGTGTEVTPNSVLSDKDSHVKKSLRAKNMFPNVAFVDPGLTRYLPSQVAAASGADALVQGLEAYLSRHASVLTDQLALKSVELSSGSLEKVVADNDEDFRAKLALASLMAGMAFANSRLGAVHGVVHSIGVISDTPHGVCCAATIPHVMEMNRDSCREKFSVLENMWGEDPVVFISRLMERIGMPSDLKHLKIEKDEREYLFEQCLPSGSLAANPRRFDRADLDELFERLLW
ncbi:MAG: iron-containing alcohol dehydrogenase [Planctomycetota bacterium]|nr:iron-containing alcohol dehydrogenase [Planctomycetota bacterium]